MVVAATDPACDFNVDNLERLTMIICWHLSFLHFFTGIQTSQDARFYGISSMLKEPFNNEDKDLVVQFTVKHEQKIDCGGGYVKIFKSDLDQKDMHGDTEYNIMFGKYIYSLWKSTSACIFI